MDQPPSETSATPIPVWPGSAYPLGATYDGAGTNFSLFSEVAEAVTIPGVVDVRVKGGIGVIELEQPVEMQSATDAAVDSGVWLRPFRNLVYAMPPYLCSEAEVEQITAGMLATARSQAKR